jgi:hypothetical protein
MRTPSLNQVDPPSLRTELADDFQGNGDIAISFVDKYQHVTDRFVW